MRKIYLLLTIIFLVGVFLRFYQLGDFPVGFFRDEASLGYNAYSILLTGKDITGHFLPLHIESFLYSPAGYSYFSIPFIFLLGLNEFSVRFASALFGSFTIFSTFFLTRIIFNKYKQKDFLSIIAAFFLAVNPWHINLSRSSTENVLVVFFISLGLIMFLEWIKKNKFYFFILSNACFVLTLLLYQAPRAFLPLFLPLLFLVFIGKDKRKWIMSFIALLFLIILRVFLILRSPTLSTRISMLSIFQQPGTQDVLNEQILEDGVAKENPTIARVFNNKLVDYSSVFLSNYFKYFSYDFFFTENALPIRYRNPSMGLLYSFELLLIPFGICFLLIKQRKIGIFLLGWLLLVPIGSSITFDDIPNLQRTLIFFPALSIISAYGLVEIENAFQKVKLLKKNFVLINFLVVFLFLYNLFYYLQSYYLHAPLHQPWFRQAGYKQLVKEVSNLSKSFNLVKITQAESNPSLFFLFYMKYAPSKFQKLLISKDKKTIHEIGFGNIPFDKYSFIQMDCPLKEDSYLDSQGTTKYIVKGKSDILYVNAGPCKIPRKNAKLLKVIKRPDSTPAFLILKYIPD